MRGFAVRMRRMRTALLLTCAREVAENVICAMPSEDATARGRAVVRSGTGARTRDAETGSRHARRGSRYARCGRQVSKWR